MSTFDYFFSEEDQRKLKSAIDQAYATIDESKRLIREQMDGPSTMLAQFEEVKADMDNIVDQIAELRTSLIHSARLNDELRLARNKAIDSAVLTGMNAYKQAWNDRLAYLLQAMPETEAKIVEWLSEAYERHKAVEPEKLAEALSAIEVLWAKLIAGEQPPLYP